MEIWCKFDEQFKVSTQKLLIFDASLKKKYRQTEIIFDANWMKMIG